MRAGLSSDDSRVTQFLMRFLVPEIIPIQEPFHLLECHGDDRIICLFGPREFFLIQLFYPHGKTRSIPIYAFEQIPTSVAEDKQTRLEWIKLHFGLDDLAQTRYLLAHVDEWAVEPDTLELSDRFHSPAPIMTWIV